MNAVSRTVLPKIAITMGDPAGIGPEIVVKALSGGDLEGICEPIVIGDLQTLRGSAEFAGIGVEQFQRTVEPFVHDMKNVGPGLVRAADSEIGGKASAEYIETAVEFWRRKEADAIATAPISKNAIAMAGYPFPGHTEFLASLTDTKDFAMSFFADDLRVVLLSIHTSLRDAIELVKKDALVKLIEFSSKELTALLDRPVKLAVAGLNPHASENGMFGSEEDREIIPAVRDCRERLGIDVSGPFSPDTIFLRGHRGEFDGVIACYHDQATIAVKCLSFGNSVNVTLGLPLIRTSVDHGTAFDIAGKGVADASSMITAIKLAADLANLKREAEINRIS